MRFGDGNKVIVKSEEWKDDSSGYMFEVGIESGKVVNSRYNSRSKSNVKVKMTFKSHSFNIV